MTVADPARQTDARDDEPTVVVDHTADVAHARADLRAARRQAAGALERFHGVRDRVVAQVTLPVTVVSESLVTGPVKVVDVEYPVWLDHVRYARNRSPEIRWRLVAHYQAPARALAKRWYRRREPIDDLVQVAMEGLLVALDRFDPRRSRPFLRFAGPTIVGLLKHHFRDHGWMIRVPRRVHDLARPVREAVDLLVQDLGRTPTATEVADVLGVPVGEVLEATGAEDARGVASLDAYTTGESGSQGGYGSTLGGPDPRLDQAEARTALAQTLELLPSRDRQVVQWYFMEDLTQAEIANRMGVSQMQVSRLLASILRRLRGHLPPG